MKTLHRYLIKKYIPPFIGTLFIAVFVFFMIFVFTYIDEIAGKGVDNWVLVRMFFYSFLMFVPASMPLAVLLSSIMTFGGLAETYELSALKSAGVSLFQIMKPLLFFIAFLAAFCFFYTNYLLPAIVLKQQSILYDVRSAKPSLNIKEGVFYNGIEGYSIRIGSKETDGKTIRNVLVYDHTERRGNVIQMYADSGRMETSDNKNELFITLFNGYRYQQVYNETRHTQTRPMLSVSFKKQTVLFDLSGFELQRTDEELFKQNAEMMNVNQLNNYIDTMKKDRKKMNLNTLTNFKDFFNSNAFKLSKKTDSLKIKAQSPIALLAKYDNLTRAQVIENALNYARSSSSFLESKVVEAEHISADEAKFKVYWHSKFTISFACIVLFFVGAPLGAIVRKGGLGMPVVISVILFIIFHVISFSCQKMALDLKIEPFLAMWIGPTLFLPFGVWLTYKAATDSALFDINKYFQPIRNGLGKLKKK